MNSLELQLDFDSAWRKAMLRDLVAIVSRRPNRLVSYQEVRRGRATVAESYRGVRSVPIARIVGSVDRVADFDRAFLPRRRHSSFRWQRVARAYADGLWLPPVKLYEVGGDYFVQDGHHRISVARLNRQQFIDAEVIAAAVPGLDDAFAPQRPVPARGLTTGLRDLVRAPGRLVPAMVRAWSPRRRAAGAAPAGACGCAPAVAGCACA